MSSRREFIRSACMLCSGAILSSALLESCVNPMHVTVTRADNKLSVPVDRFSHEKGTYPFLLLQDSSLPYSIALYRLADGSYSALKTVCTHNSCDLHAHKESLVCPCHGSEFDKNGNVLNGPASTNLTRFETQSDGKMIHIFLSKIK